MTGRFKATLLGVGVIAIAMVIAGCTISANPLTGEVFVTPAFGEDPSMGGRYRKTTINGRCYRSNGVWCLPCDQDGELQRCADILQDSAPNSERLASLVSSFADGRIDQGEFIDAMFAVDEEAAHEEGPGIDLPAEFLVLTGGLTGPEFLAVSGWPTGVGVSESINTRARVHHFTDENGEDAVDFTFLWRADWPQPDDIPGVTLWMWMTGNLADDDPRDLQVFRVAGPEAGVTAALDVMRAEGTPVQVLLENGATFTF
jgi:hypothetical protein